MLPETPNSPRKPRASIDDTQILSPDEIPGEFRALQIPNSSRQPRASIYDTKILPPDAVPEELRALQAEYAIAHPRRRPEPSSPEQQFVLQKQQILKTIRDSIQIEEKRLDRADDKLQHPYKRIRRGEVVQSNEDLISQKKEAEKKLVSLQLQLTCVQRSRATTLDAFQVELLRAQEQAATELQHAFDDQTTPPDALLSKRKILQALTELEDVVKSTLR